MNITRIKINKITPNQGLIAFVSVVVDNWLFLNNIAIFSRLNKPNEIRLVFPEKKINDKKISIFYPLNSKEYFLLEDIIKKEFYAT